MLTKKANAAAHLFDRMDHDLQNAFFTCYMNFGKVSTKKLIACFCNRPTVNVVRQVLEQNEFGVPSPPSKLYKISEEGNSGTVDCPDWLAAMPVGPGVSPCVNSTCIAFLEEALEGQEGEEMPVDSLRFFEALCGIARGPSRIVSSRDIDVGAIVARERMLSRVLRERFE
jgi:hypothetical protein